MPVYCNFTKCCRFRCCQLTGLFHSVSIHKQIKRSVLVASKQENVRLGQVDHVMHPTGALRHSQGPPLVLLHQSPLGDPLGQPLWQDDVSVFILIVSVSL